jgi:hypothetical protein
MIRKKNEASICNHDGTNRGLPILYSKLIAWTPKCSKGSVFTYSFQGQQVIQHPWSPQETSKRIPFWVQNIGRRTYSFFSRKIRERERSSVRSTRLSHDHQISSKGNIWWGGIVEIGIQIKVSTSCEPTIAHNH